MPCLENTPLSCVDVFVASEGSTDPQGKLGGSPSGTCQPPDAWCLTEELDSVNCGGDAEPAHQLSTVKIPDSQEPGERRDIVVLSC